jgi:hypothetical protein
MATREAHTRSVFVAHLRHIGHIDTGTLLYRPPGTVTLLANKREDVDDAASAITHGGSQMGTPGDRRDLQSVIDFLATPLIVDVIRAIRDGHRPRQRPELCRYGDAVDAAVEALVQAGAVAGQAGRKQPDGEPLLRLTAKGRVVCALIDKVVDLPAVGVPATQPTERVKVG